MSVDSRRALGSRYELVELLGRGAMGEVWLAVDRNDNSEVAAKLLRNELVNDPEVVARFIQERSILVNLTAPGIVRVRDLVVEGDSLAIVMDLVRGGDLRARLKEHGTFSPRVAVGLTIAVMEALSAAHAAGCLHRDVKPDNVLLTREGELEPKDLRLSDFGIARLAQESTVMATGLLGTPSYMPPELFVHGSFSAASDVYAAGIVLYELLAGRTPFAGPGTAHTMGNRHVSSAPPELPVHPALWRALATMLAKDPSQRLSAAATAEQLRSLPESALSDQALPVQPAPEHWDVVDTPSAPIRVHEAPAGIDVGATYVPSAAASSATPIAQPGQVVDLVGSGPGEVTDDQTRIGVSAAPAPAPVLTPTVTVADKKKRPAWFLPLIVIACLALVAGIGFGAKALLGKRSKSNAPTAVGEINATLVSDPLPTGLTVTREARYDAEDQVVDLTIRYTAQASELRGPFLEVIPPARKGEQCPLVAWDGAAVEPNLPQVSGIDIACAFSVDPEPVPAQSSVTVSGEVSVTLAPDSAALQDWLASIETNTDNALTSQTSGAGYPVQRLDDVAVEVPHHVGVGSGALRVRLLPIWRGAEGPDPYDVLYDSTSIGAPSELLQRVAGGYQGVRLADGCDGAISVIDRRRVGVLRASDDCRVEAQLGNFTDLESPTFIIASAGG